jgi:hypothetical protein
MTDKDRGAKPQPNEILPADEDLEEDLGEEPEEFVEADDEFEEEPETLASTAAAPAAAQRRQGRGAAEPARRSLGSVREAHERVHVDDRLSAAFAVLCAAALLGVLLLPSLGSFLPAPAAPTLTPLVVPTFNATPAPSGSASLVPSASVAPTATPAATATPTATATPAASPSAS